MKKYRIILLFVCITRIISVNSRENIIPIATDSLNKTSVAAEQDTTVMIQRSTSSSNPVQSIIGQVVIPPDPMEANFAQYMEVPVGYNTGIPNISIPLYTIEMNGYSLPITLSYHNSGIKVDQMASEVGLGWTLNTGGSLSRTVNGELDENKNISIGDYETYTDLFSHEKTIDTFFQYQVDNTGGFNPDDGLDRDMFNFSIPEGSGRFFYVNEKGIHVNTANNEKIHLPGIDGNGNKDFRTSSGTTYSFGEGLISEIPIGSLKYNVATSWKMSKIETSCKEVIDYEYYDTYYYRNLYAPTFSKKCGSSGITITSGPNGQFEKYQGAVIKKITFPGGSIEFKPGAKREDMLNKGGSQFDNFPIEAVCVFNGNRDTVKHWLFVYEYATASGADPSYERKRLMLKSVKEVRSGEEYSFEYDPTPLPSKLSKAKDYYGYNNNRTSNDSPFPDDEYNNVKSNPLLASREPNPEAVKALSLTRIIYPGGGSITYDMGMHRSIQPYYSSCGDSFINVGGLRVDSIIWKDENNKVVKKEAYDYEDGHILFRPQFYAPSISIKSRESTDVSGHIIQQIYAECDVVSTGNPFVDEDQAVAVYYDLITRSFLDNTGQKYSEEYEYQSNQYTFKTSAVSATRKMSYNIRHTDNRFEITGSVSLDHWSANRNNYVLSVLRNRLYYGQSFYEDSPLLSITYKDQNNNMVKTIKNTVVRKDGTTYYGIIRTNTIDGTGTDPNSITVGNISHFFSCYIYPISTGRVETVKTEIKEQNVSTETGYTYDEKSGNLIRQETLDSRGNSVVETFMHGLDKITTDFISAYPGWLIKTTSLGDPGNPDWNRDDLLLYKKTHNGKIQEAYTVDYNNKGMPTCVYQACTGDDASCFNNRVHTRYKYNDRHEPIEKDALGIKEVFIRSYDGRYPVIRIIGTSGSEQVKSIIASNNLRVDANMIIANTNDIENVAAGLRSAFSQTPVQVYSYTYKPLVGMLSATDGRGIKTNYKYDNAGRLICATDRNNKELASYEYHYKNRNSSSDHTYVRTRKILSSDGTEHIDNFKYFDGLGRLIQSVDKGITPGRFDLVTLKEYDDFGRESKNRLPVAFSGNGAYQTPSSVITKTQNFYGDTKPYSEVICEPSSLNRPEREFGPGVNWRAGSGHPIKKEYLCNDNTLHACKYYYISGNAVRNSGNYAPNSLFVSKITDEDGNVSLEFTDKLGRVLLQRQTDAGTNHDTYYIYDDFGNLKAVIPPGLTTGNISLTATLMQIYGYVYEYDNLKRCISKKLPGADPVYFEYDTADRVIFSQDGEQRLKNKWFFTLSDAVGRPAVEGLCYSTGRSISGVAKAVYAKGSSSPNKLSNCGYISEGVTIQSLDQILKINYYDNYDFRSLGFSSAEFNYTLPAGFENKRYDNDTDAVLSKGLLTGSREIGTYSVFFYDDKGMPIQSIVKNSLNGYDKEYVNYSFTGQPTRSQKTHTPASLTETFRYNYDHADRPTETYCKINNDPEILLSKLTYDDLGRVMRKSLHNGKINIDYTYNIRSWITSIVSPWFREDLRYETPYGDLYSSLCYNGNISAVAWSHNNYGFNDHIYQYRYDELNRLKKATYYTVMGGSSVYLTDQFSEEAEYDKMGNITRLKRNANLSSGIWDSSTLIDNLSMNYNGNQLSGIIESASSPYGFIKNGWLEQGNEYVYNKNGALAQDFNADISGIRYNVLNLPERIQFRNGNNTTYVYDGTGRKLSVTHQTVKVPLSAPLAMGVTDYGEYSPSLFVSMKTNYCTNLIYEAGSLKYARHGEGYVEPVNGTFRYCYYLIDHLGNNRSVAVFTSATAATATATQKMNYYPFGMPYPETPMSGIVGAESQPFKFGGKEFDEMHGLNWYDFEARQYNGMLGRFMSPDPLAEKKPWLSQYVFCSNNPTNRIDPDGRADYWAINNDGLKYLGNDGVDDDAFRIGQMSNGHAGSIEKAIKNMRKGRASDDDRNAIYGENSIFVDLEIQSETDQNNVINDLQAEQNASGEEQGSIMSISFGNGRASLSFGPRVEGTSENITFRFTGSYDNLKDRNGNIVIGTIHTHSHNRGLSGQGMDERAGAGDMENVANSYIPWYTVGPSRTHVGYKDKWGRVNHTQLPRGTNLLKDALLKIKR